MRDEVSVEVNVEVRVAAVPRLELRRLAKSMIVTAVTTGKRRTRKDGQPKLDSERACSYNITRMHTKRGMILD